MDIALRSFPFLSIPYHTMPFQSNPVGFCWAGSFRIVATVTARPSPIHVARASQPARSPAEIVAHIHTQQHCAATQNPFTLSFCRVCLWLTQWLKCLGLVFAFCLVFDWKTMAAPEWVGVRPDGGHFPEGRTFWTALQMPKLDLESLSNRPRHWRGPRINDLA